MFFNFDNKLINLNYVTSFEFKAYFQHFDDDDKQPEPRVFMFFQLDNEVAYNKTYKSVEEFIDYMNSLINDLIEYDKTAASGFSRAMRAQLERINEFVENPLSSKLEVMV